MHLHFNQEATTILLAAIFFPISTKSDWPANIFGKENQKKILKYARKKKT